MKIGSVFVFDTLIVRGSEFKDVKSLRFFGCSGICNTVQREKNHPPYVVLNLDNLLLWQIFKSLVPLILFISLFLLILIFFGKAHLKIFRGLSG